MREEYLSKISKNNIINFVKLPEGKHMPLEDIFNLRNKTIITSNIDIRNVLNDVIQIIHHEYYDKNNEIDKEVFVYILSKTIFNHREEFRELDFLDIDYEATTHNLNKVYIKNPGIKFEEIVYVDYINNESESEKALNLLKTVGVSEGIKSLLFDTTLPNFKANKDTVRNIMTNLLPKNKTPLNLDIYNRVVNDALTALNSKDSVRKYENEDIVVFYLEEKDDEYDFYHTDSIIKIRKNDKINPISIYKELKTSSTGIFNCKINEIVVGDNHIYNMERILLLGTNYYYLSDMKEI